MSRLRAGVMHLSLAAWSLGASGFFAVTGCTRQHAPTAASTEPGAVDSTAHARLSAQVAEQLDAELQFSPTLATWLGDHSSDDRLDDLRMETVLREVVRLDNLLDRVRRENDSWPSPPVDAGTPADAQVAGGGELDEPAPGGMKPPASAGPPAAPSAPDLGVVTHDAVTLLATLPAESVAGHPEAAQRLDRILLQARIEARRFELTEWRPHERSPLYYANLIAFGLDSLLGPSLATPTGLRALRGRLGDIPAVCSAAIRNLKNPPEIWTKRAIEVNQMTRDFVAGLLPRILANLNLSLDPKLQEEVNHQRDEAQRSLEDFGAWMSRDLLPRSKGDWALPADRLQVRLRATELLDVPLDIVQDRAEFEHRETRHHLEELAKRLTGITNPTRAVTEALHAIEEDHPRAEELAHAVDAALDKVYELSTAQALLTVPTQRPQVVEMPAYRFGFLQLMLPAPLEADRTAQLLFDPVDPSWKDKKRVSDHLRMLNRSQLLLTMLHDVMPGRFAQQQAQSAFAASLSPLRQRTRSLAFLEGWAGYAEQLVALSGGVAAVPGPLPVTGPPPALAPPAGMVPGQPSDRLQILVLRLQLLRLGRLLVALRLHAPQSGSPAPSDRLDAAEDFFTAECFLDEYAARREVERATFDPLYGAAALGRLQLGQLRADYQAEHPDDFTVKGFHDALLAQGALPVVALRQLLLHHRGPSLRPPPEPDPSEPSPEEKRPAAATP